MGRKNRNKEKKQDVQETPEMVEETVQNTVDTTDTAAQETVQETPEVAADTVSPVDTTEQEPTETVDTVETVNQGSSEETTDTEVQEETIDTTGGTKEEISLEVDSVPPKVKIPFDTLAHAVAGNTTPQIGCNAQLALLNSIEAGLDTGSTNIAEIFSVFKETRDDVFPDGTVARWELDWPFDAESKTTFNTFFVVLNQLANDDKDTIDKDLVLNAISDKYPAIKVALDSIL